MKLNSKIWIPGASGFVGSHLTERLKGLGYTNVIPTGRELDVCDENAVNSFIDHNNIDVIFFCSAKVGGIAANIKDPYSFLLDNLKMQNNVINAAGLYEVKKVVFLGSSCIYPKDYPHQPLKEEYLLQAPLEPTNEGYALAKISGLKLCEYANKKFSNTHYVCLMPSNLYGPRDHFDSESSHALAGLISRAYKIKHEGLTEMTIWGTGIPRREWLFIDDLIDCMLWSVDNVPKSFNGFLNVGTGVDTSMSELADLICKKLGWTGYQFKYDTTRPDGMIKKCTDVTKINALGWKAKTSLEEGLQKTIEWYLKEKKDHEKWE